MSVTTDAYTNADVAAMIPEIWSPIVNEALFPRAVLANWVTDLTDYMSEGGDIVHVPDIFTNTFTAKTQSTQGAEVDTESVAQVDVTLTVNTHKYVAFLIGDLTMKQLARKYSLNEKYAKEAQNVLVIALEDSLAALWSSLSTNTVGDTTTVLTDLEIRTAIDKLDTLNYDLSEIAFFFHPFVYWRQLGGITKYYRTNESKLDFIKTGNFGKMGFERGLKGILYDVQVFTTPRIVSGLQTYRNLLLHKSCFGFAVQNQGMGRVRVQAQYLLKNLGTLTVADIMYGVGVLREPAGVVVNANTSATQS